MLTYANKQVEELGQHTSAILTTPLQRDLRRLVWEGGQLTLQPQEAPPPPQAADASGGERTGTATGIGEAETAATAPASGASPPHTSAPAVRPTSSGLLLLYFERPISSGLMLLYIERAGATICLASSYW